MNWKETYTKLFLKELDKSVDDTTVKQYLPIWWKNTREKDSGGLRLTQTGYETIMEIGLETYEVFFPKDMPVTVQVIIFLDKFIDCPYYLFDNSIVVTKEKKAVELTLFSGDIRKYGFLKAMSRSKKSEKTS